MAKFTIPPEQLRWRPDASKIEESSTRDARSLSGMVGQSRARTALRFALASKSRNHNVFVRGPEGCGRRTLIDSVLSDLKLSAESLQDFCYVHNFSNPDRPHLIVLPGGQGRHFQHAMTRISLFVRDRLPEILKNDPIRSRREARKEAAEREIRLKIAPLEKRLAADGLALIRTQTGPSSRVSIYPLVMGKPVSPEEYRNLVTQNQAREEDRLKSVKKAETWQSEVNRFANDVNQIWQQALQHIDQINATETARILGELTGEVARKFKAPGLEVYLREIIDDIVEKRIGRDTSHLADPTLLYGANVLTSRNDKSRAPVVHANQPSMANLFGTIDPAWMSSGRAVTSFRGIRTGALLEADGGVLILDAADLLAEHGSWRMLKRALRTGLAEVVPPELGWPYSAQSLKPEPIPVNVRIILTGDKQTFAKLNTEDRDFPHLFKVLADFDTTMERDRDGMNGYLRFLAQLVEKDGLTDFDHGGILAMIEQGARMSDEPGRLSAVFGDLADLAREASDRAREDGSGEVSREHVEQAATQRRDRTVLPFLRLIRSLEQGRVQIEVKGRAEARINTLAVNLTGNLNCALPCSISAATGRAQDFRVVGDGGDLRNRLAIVLGNLLKLDQPPTLLANFSTSPDEPCNGTGLDLARACALLSSLAGVALRQDIAVIGDLDDQGMVQAVDAVNERIECFFDLSRHVGLSGQQAVIIPRANAADLMLDREVVKACSNDMFRVYAVDTLAQALEMVMGSRLGTWKDGAFTENSPLAKAREWLA
jgi:predicted ATP-dependent protease